MDLLEIRRATNGALRADRLPDGRHRITVATAPGFAGAVTTWTTAYPLALVREIHEVKGPYVCDEIMREEDPRYVEHSLRREVFGYLDPSAFEGKRILDFGCGSGASALVLRRLVRSCEIVGVER